jgi:hypothetical protein
MPSLKKRYFYDWNNRVKSDKRANRARPEKKRSQLEHSKTE